MRKKHSFLLTIFPTEEQQADLRGRVQMISTGSTYTFTNLEELQKLIESEIQAGEAPGFLPGIHEMKPSYQAVDSQHEKEAP